MTAKTIRKILQFEDVSQLITTLEHLQHTIFMGVFWFKMLVFHCFFPTVSWMVIGKRRIFSFTHLRCVYEIAEAVASKVEFRGKFYTEMGWAFLEGTIFPKVGNLWKFIYQWIQQHWNPRGGILMRFSGLQSEKTKLVSFIIGLWSKGSHREGPGFVLKYVGLRVYTEGRSWDTLYNNSESGQRRRHGKEMSLK